LIAFARASPLRDFTVQQGDEFEVTLRVLIGLGFADNGLTQNIRSERDVVIICLAEGGNDLAFLMADHELAGHGDYL
jgi:hypothetical protein